MHPLSETGVDLGSKATFIKRLTKKDYFFKISVEITKKGCKFAIRKNSNVFSKKFKRNLLRYGLKKDLVFFIKSIVGLEISFIFAPAKR